MTAVQYMAIHVGADVQIIGTDMHLQSQNVPYNEHILFQSKKVFLCYVHTPKKEHAKQMATNAYSIVCIYCKNKTWSLFCLKTIILSTLH